MTGTSKRKTRLRIQVPIARNNLYHGSSLFRIIGALGCDSSRRAAETMGGSDGSDVCGVEGSSVNTERV